MHVKGPERVLLERGDDHDERQRCRRDFRDGLEAVAARHLHVEEGDVGPVRHHRVRRLRASAALRDDLHVRVAQEEEMQRPPAGGLVVGDDRPDPHRRTQGTSSATTAPPRSPGTVVSVKSEP
jgi:hypothetical protein